MIHEISEALNNKNHFSLAMNAADLAARNRGDGSVSPTIANSVGLDVDYVDLMQYLSDGAIEEDPIIGVFRRALLIEKGYEKVGHFFKARLAEFRHIMPKHDFLKFGYNHLQERMNNEENLNEENIVKILHEEAGFLFFHGMMRPSYKELLLFDRIKKVIPNGKILDYGTDNGDTALYANMMGFDTTVAQVEGYMVESIEKRFRLRKLSTKALRLSEQDPIPEMPFNNFHMIFANDSLINTSDPLLVLEEFRIALRKNGCLVLSRYPLEKSYDGIIMDSAGRRKIITDYLEKHFEPTSIPEVFKKI